MLRGDRDGAARAPRPAERRHNDNARPERGRSPIAGTCGRRCVRPRTCSEGGHRCDCSQLNRTMFALSLVTFLVALVMVALLMPIASSTARLARRPTIISTQQLTQQGHQPNFARGNASPHAICMEIRGRPVGEQVEESCCLGNDEGLRCDARRRVYPVAPIARTNAAATLREHFVEAAQKLGFAMPWARW